MLALEQSIYKYGVAPSVALISDCCVKRKARYKSVLIINPIQA
jgi:hypothetical protein